MKLVINKCYGGFGLSLAGLKRYVELKGKKVYLVITTGDTFEERWKSKTYRTARQDDIANPRGDVYVSTARPSKTTEKTIVWQHNLDRADPALVQTVEELGAAANGAYAELKVVEIPDGTEWGLHEYDGIETVEEQHESWG